MNSCKKSTIELAMTIILVGFFCAVCFHYIAHYYFHIKYPLDTFLYIPGQQFTDFWVVLTASASKNPYHIVQNNPLSAYFPFSYLLIHPLTYIDRNYALILFLLMYLIGFLVFNKYFLSDSFLKSDQKINNIKNLFIFTFMTYPFLFCLERGNFEVLVFFFTTIGLFFYSKKKFIVSVVFLAFATAIKAYPGIFILIFLSDKRYKEASLFLVLTGILTLIAMLMFKDTMAEQLHGFLAGIKWVKDGYFQTNQSLIFNTSLYGIFKTIFHLYHKILWGSQSKTSDHYIYIYSIFTIPCLIVISLYTLFVEKTFWKKIAVLICSYLLFPEMAYDYRLLHVYIIFYFFIDSIVSENRECLHWFYTVILALLLIPKNYYLIYGEESISCFINVFLILMLLGTIIFTGLKKFAEVRALGIGSKCSHRLNQ